MRRFMGADPVHGLAPNVRLHSAHRALLWPAGVILAVFVFWATPGSGQEIWPPPQMRTISSANGQVRVQVIPRRPRSSGRSRAVATGTSRIEGIHPAEVRLAARRELARLGEGIPAHSPGNCLAVVQRQTPSGSWQTVTHCWLANDVAPVQTLIDNEGRRLVTIDEWGRLGQGPRVVTWYRLPEGTPESIGLQDLLTSTEYERALRVGDSIYWGGKHRLSDDGEKLLIEIQQPDSPVPRRVLLDLTSGKVVSSSPE